jgi:hypothetical protein
LQVTEEEWNASLAVVNVDPKTGKKWISPSKKVMDDLRPSLDKDAQRTKQALLKRALDQIPVLIEDYLNPGIPDILPSTKQLPVPHVIELRRLEESLIQQGNMRKQNHEHDGHHKGQEKSDKQAAKDPLTSKVVSSSSVGPQSNTQSESEKVSKNPLTSPQSETQPESEKVSENPLTSPQSETQPESKKVSENPLTSPQIETQPESEKVSENPPLITSEAVVGDSQSKTNPEREKGSETGIEGEEPSQLQKEGADFNMPASPRDESDDEQDDVVLPVDEGQPQNDEPGQKPTPTGVKDRHGALNKRSGAAGHVPPSTSTPAGAARATSENLFSVAHQDQVAGDYEPDPGDGLGFGVEEFGNVSDIPVITPSSRIADCHPGYSVASTLQGKLYLFILNVKLSDLL